MKCKMPLRNHVVSVALLLIVVLIGLKLPFLSNPIRFQHLYCHNSNCGLPGPAFIKSFLGLQITNVNFTPPV